ncbi:UNC93-like protein MFSD11 isoform X2 [Tubulanus polymorphus]|uniref:UNC93-like protein MFSD11 isoform X2 n=1 Tax=Tubulanus polymorphus TaxID=672921 RepID=UPI003DA5157F
MAEFYDIRLARIIVLGISFMLMFTAFQTCSMIEETVIEGAINEPNSTFTGNGYTSLAIIYASFAVSNWAAPSIVSVLGLKISMMVSGAIYALFIASFLKPMTWALYTMSVLVGIAAAVIWTAQGSYLTINSDSDTIAITSGIFWALFQCSLLIGNVYVYFTFKGDITVDAATRTTLFLVFTAVCVAGVLFLAILFCLKGRQETSMESLVVPINPGDGENRGNNGPLQALKRSFHLFITREMLLLSVTFGFTGLSLTFFSGVYGTCVGHSQKFGTDAKGLIGICGIFIGVGEILGGALFGLFGKWIKRFGRDPIVLFGFLVNITTYYLIFLNLPQMSPIEETDGAVYVDFGKFSKYVAVICAFLIGLGDSSFNTQIYSMLGFLYPEDSAPAFALFKFVQSVLTAVGFFYSTALQLEFQLLIMVIGTTLGTLSFFVVEHSGNLHNRSGYAEIGSSM